MYQINLQLSKLLGIQVCREEFNGEVVDFIKFPAKVNGVCFSKKNHIWWNLCMYECAPNQWGQSHYLSLYIQDPKIREFYIKSDWLKKMRFFGIAKQGEDKNRFTPKDRKLVKKDDILYGIDNE